MTSPRRPVRGTLATIGLACIVLPSGAARGQEPCPASCVALRYGAMSCGTAPVRDSSTALPSLCRASYDLIAGTARASADSRSETAPARAAVEGRDRYVVTGLAGPTPLVARLEFHVVLRSSCEYFQCSSSWAHVGLIGQGRSASFDQGSYDLSQNVDLRSSVEITLDVVPDVAFDLMFQLETNAEYTTNNANTLLTSELRFPDLPPGARVHSCQGYLDGTVPATPASWGRVKAIYR